MVEPRQREASWAEFLRLWEKFLDDSDRPGTVVVVEGERDRISLQRLGVRAPVVLVHHGRTLAQVAHELTVSATRAVVLTDWDTEGGHLARRLRGFLVPNRLDLDFRRRLARVLRGEIVHVEGLAGWARRLAERDGVTFEGVFERPG
jgi:5S rRNA maturation endonuclease (ribonuclease M5)